MSNSLKQRRRCDFWHEREKSEAIELLEVAPTHVGGGRAIAFKVIIQLIRQLVRGGSW